MTKREVIEFAESYRMPMFVYDLTDEECRELSEWADARSREVMEAKLARNKAEARASRVEAALKGLVNACPDSDFVRDAALAADLDPADMIEEASLTYRDALAVAREALETKP